MVLTTHYVAGTIVTRPGSWLWYAFEPLRLGYTGVDLFFVLSGFLIGGILLDVRHSRSYYYTFYARRIHRIFPLYFLWFAVFVILLLVGAIRDRPYMKVVLEPTLPVWSYVLFVQNIAAVHMRNFGPFWLAATWSLAVEEQFYLFFPVVVRNLAGKVFFAAVLLCILAAPISRAFFSNNPFAQGLLLSSHLDDLGLGVLGALILRRYSIQDLLRFRWHLYGALTLAFLIAIFAIWQAFLKHNPFWTVAIGSIFSVFFVLVLAVTILCPGPHFGRLLRSRFLQASGRLSYAIYVFHQGLLFLVFGLLFHRTPSLYDFESFIAVVICLALTVALSLISWKFLENPLIRIGHGRYTYSADSLQESNRSLRR